MAPSLLHRIWFRATLVVVAGAIVLIAGLIFFSSQMRQQIAISAAHRAFGHSKLNLLLLGFQADEATTDSVIFLHLDADRQMATLMSIPRDTWVPIPGQGSSKINAAYAYGGAKTTARVVSQLMGGVPIDATIALQPEGAARVVDALGGLDVNVDEDMDYDDNSGQLHIHLKHGQQHLSGDQVVGYIRFRHDGASDFGRVKRQQQVLKLMMDQLSQPQNWARLPRILKIARRNVATSLTDQQLAALLGIYRNVPDDNMRTFTLPSKAGWVGDASVVFADPHWPKLIGSVLFREVDPPQDEVLVANATGRTDFDRTIVGALRGGGWNVVTFVDQPVKKRSSVIGTSAAAQSLAKTFAMMLRSGKGTALVIGTDLAPDTQ